MTSVYARAQCELCPTLVPLASKAVFRITDQQGRVHYVCFQCARKLRNMGLLPEEKVPDIPPPAGRIVEI